MSGITIRPSDTGAARIALRSIRALLLLLFLAVPASAQEAEQPKPTISTRTDAARDAAIAERLSGILAALDDYDDIDVSVRAGIVTLAGKVIDSTAIPKLEEIATRLDGVVAIRNDVTVDTDVSTRLDPVLTRFRTRLVQVVNYLPLLAVALLAGVAVAGTGLLLSRWKRPWSRLAPNAFIAEIYGVILRLAFLIAGVVVALDILNATAILTGLFGAAGILGLAVGFAVRDTVENFIASIMLSLRQPFRPNDIVDIDGSIGTVVRLTSRATILLDPDGNHVRLSNSFVFKAKIVNYTRNESRRFGFTLGIDPNDDLSQARRIGLRTLSALEFVLSEPPPQVWVQDAGDSTITMEFHGWVDQDQAEFLVARGEALRAVMNALTRAGIGLPEPSYRLNLTGGGLPVIDLPDRAARSGEMVITEAEPEPDAPPETETEKETVTPDRTIDRLVSREREEGGDEDLLDHDAPRE